MEIDLQKELNEGRTLLAVIPTREYAATVNSLLKQLNKDYSRIMYISLNKLITPLRREMEAQGLQLDKFSFIDGITKTAIPNPPTIHNCTYIPSPDDLTKLGIATTKVLQTFDPDCLFFDSLSSLLIYEDPGVVNQFVHSLVNKVNAYGTRAVFTCLDGQKEEEVVRGLSLILDRVVGQTRK